MARKSVRRSDGTVVINGVTYNTMREAAKKNGLGEHVLHYRIKNNFPEEELLKPVKKKGVVDKVDESQPARPSYFSIDELLDKDSLSRGKWWEVQSREVDRDDHRLPD